MSKRILRSLMIVGAAVISIGGLSDSATGDVTESTADVGQNATWSTDYSVEDSTPDKGGLNISERVYKYDGVDWDEVVGNFQAYDEQLRILDNHENGRPGVVKVWVGGSGPALYYAYSGDDGRLRELDLSFAEGQSIQMKVCTSDSPKAKCTDKVTHTGIT